MRGQAMHAAHMEAAEGVGATFPVMSTNHNTYDAVTAIAKIQPSIRPTSKAKIHEAKVGVKSRRLNGCNCAFYCYITLLEHAAAGLAICWQERQHVVSVAASITA